MTAPLTAMQRVARYARQNGKARISARQWRRVDQKQGRAQARVGGAA